MDSTVRDREATSIRTFLIADVRGYTRFTQERGDAAAARLATTFATIVQQGVEAHGGELIELRGDEGLAVFASARRAIGAAMELQSAFAEESATDPSYPLPVGIGLDAGEAIPVGAGYRGGALNLAARLCATAGPGEVLATREVVHLARAVEGITYRPRGEVEFKGLDEPVMVMEIVGLTPPAPPTARPPTTPPDAEPLELPWELDPVTPIVGRDRDLRWLSWAWRRARHGHGRAVFVSGPAGIGKTRLVAELARSVHGAGGTVLYASWRAGGPETTALIRRARSAVGPALVIADDLDAAGRDVLKALGALAASVEATPVLFVGTYRDGTDAQEIASLVHGADGAGDGPRRLGPLDADGVRSVAGLYVGEAAQELAIPAVMEATGGVPGPVHRIVGAWARARASGRLGASSERAARDRGGLRTAESEVAGDVVDLQLVQELAELYGSESPEDLADLGPAPVPCPYKGLATFGAADAEYFFGRERLVAELVARLVGSTFLAVVGPSGSGKSSAVRAGLMPALSSGVLPGSERWMQVVMRPGEHPMAELERALAVIEPAASGDAGIGPLDGAASAVPKEGRLVLLVDQFEEAFTACRDDEERAAFVRELTAGDERTIVVLAVRADYYGDCAAYPELADRLGASHVLVGPMQPDELRRAIELPARRVGLRVEPELVDGLVADVVGEPGALPLLSTTLLELWQRREGRTLTMAAYRRIGGVRGSVARLAEDAFGRLSPEQQILARAILLRLAGAGEGEAVVRRRVPLTEFDADRNADAAAVLATLTDARLLTADEGSVEVAHEALLREWPRLRAWLEDDVQGRQLHRQLMEIARQWEDGGRDRADLYRGARLASALDWTAGHAAELNERERAFLEESRGDAERQALRARKTNRRLRTLLAGVAIFLAVALVAGSVALVQRSHARNEARLAAEQALVSDARHLAAQSLVENHLDRSLQLALAAVRLKDIPETRDALFSRLVESPAALRVMRGSQFHLLSLAISPDGKTLVAGGSSGRVDVFDLARGQRVAESAKLGFAVNNGSSSGGRYTEFSPDGRSLAVAGVDTVGNGFLDLLDTVSWGIRLKVSIPVHPQTVIEGLAWSPDGGELAAAEVHLGDALSKDVDIFDGETGRPTSRFPLTNDDLGNGTGWLAFWSNDFLITSTAAGGTQPKGRTEVWDIASHELVRPFHIGGPLALSPDGRMASIGEADGSVVLLDLKSGAQQQLQGKHDTFVNDVAFSPDGATLVSTGSDRNVIVWDVSSRKIRETLIGHGGRVWRVAFGRDGRTIYSCSEDGSVIVWDLTGGRSLLRPYAAGPGNGGAWMYVNTGGTVIATRLGQGYLGSTGLNPIVFVDAKTLSKMGTVPGWDGGTSALALSPHGSVLATAGKDSVVQLWNVKTQALDATLSTRSKGSYAYAGAFSPDGKTFAIGSQDPSKKGTPVTSTITVWDTTGQPKWNRTVPQQVFRVSFSQDGRYVVGVVGALQAVDAQQADVLEVSTGRLVFQSPVFDLNGDAALSPDGGTVFIGDGFGNVSSWDVSSGKPAGPKFVASSDRILDLDVSAKGDLLAVGGELGAVSIWNLKTGQRVGPDLQWPVRSGNVPYALVQFTANEQLVVGYADGTGMVLDLNPSDWEARACAAAGPLSPEAWRGLVPDQPYQDICR